MRPFTTTCLILLTCVPPTLGQLQFLFPKQVPSCHYPSLTTGTYIHFISPNDTSFEFSIYTEWTRYYPDTLRSVLAQSGFILAPLPKEPSKNKTEFCGWNTVDIMKVKGWHRGEVSFKDLTITAPPLPILPASVKPPARPQSPAAVKPLHQPQQPAPKGSSVYLIERAATVPRPTRLPNNSTLNYIHAILLANSPYADIAILILEICVPIWCTIGILSLLLLISHCLRRCLYPRSPMADEESQDIELSSLNGKSVSESSQNPFVELTKPKNEERFYTARLKNDEQYVNAGARVYEPRSSSVYSRSVDG